LKNAATFIGDLARDSSRLRVGKGNKQTQTGKSEQKPRSNSHSYSFNLPLDSPRATGPNGSLKFATH
jgi:hypothetical protein